MAAITLSGTIKTCELVKRVDPDYLGMRKYSPNTERYLYTLNICLESAGKRYFFNSPAYRMNVTNCPIAAIVTFLPENKDSENWFRVDGEPGSGIATAERSNTNKLIPLVKAGDTLTIRASIKAEKPTYISLNRVKMVKTID